MKSIFFVICFGIFAVAQAQQKPGGMGPISGQIGTQAGNYNFTHFDQTDLYKSIVDNISKKNRDDVEYFESRVSLINREIDALISQIYEPKSQNGEGLISMSNRSAYLGETLELASYFQEITNLKKSLLQTRRMAEGLETITKAFPSQVSVSVGNTKNSIPNYRNINFGAAKDYFLKTLNDLESLAKNLPFRILLNNGAMQTIDKNSGFGLDPNFDPFQLSPKQIAEYRLKIKEARSWSRTEKAEIERYTNQVRKVVQTFISTYGSSEKYRYDAKTEALMSQEAKNLSEIFFARSLFRFAYGMQLGAIGIQYKTQVFNLDQIFHTNNLRFLEQAIFDQNSIMEQRKNLENAKSLMASRTTTLVSSSSIIDKINRVFTVLKGNDRLVAAQFLVFDMILNDFVEETQLYSASGMIDGDSSADPQMIAFNERYFATREKRNYFDPLKKKYSQILSGENTAPIPVGSLLGSYANVADLGLGKQDQMAVADQLQEQIRLSSRLSSGRRNQTNDRLKRIGR